MAKERLEKLLVETMKSLLDQDDLGRVDSGDERSHHVQFRHEDILDSYAIAVKDSEFFDSLNAAFYKVNNYKWIHDSTFEEALTSELESQGIPHDEIAKALEALDKVRTEYLGDDPRENENGVGWPENLKDIKKVTQEPHNKPVSDLDKETMSGDNKPFSGVGPDKVRPARNEA